MILHKFLKYKGWRGKSNGPLQKKLPLKKSSLIRVKDICEFDKSLIKSYNEESDEGYFLEVDVQYSEILHILPNVVPFSPGRMKIEKIGKKKKKSYMINLHDILNMLST